MVEAGLAGEGEEPSDALLGAGVGEGAPDVPGERAGSADGGEGMGAAVDAVPEADARPQLSIGCCRHRHERCVGGVLEITVAL